MSEINIPVVLLSYERKFIVNIPNDLITTEGFIDKYICKTIAQAIESLDIALNSWKDDNSKQPFNRANIHSRNRIANKNNNNK